MKFKVGDPVIIFLKEVKSLAPHFPGAKRLVGAILHDDGEFYLVALPGGLSVTVAHCYAHNPHDQHQTNRSMLFVLDDTY